MDDDDDSGSDFNDSNGYNDGGEFRVRCRDGGERAVGDDCVDGGEENGAGDGNWYVGDDGGGNFGDDGDNDDDGNGNAGGDEDNYA